MSEKLAVKHKNSLALTKHKLLHQDSGRKRCCSCSKPNKLAIFSITTCCIFVVYWIILTPLLFSLPHNSSSQWSAVWFVLYWFLAFLVWLFIMLCIIVIWRCFDSNHDDMKLQSYGTNGSSKPVLLTDSVKLKDIKQDDEYLNDLRPDKNDIVHDQKDINIVEEPHDKIKKHKDLPPLVIHRRNLGNDIECAGTVSIEKIDENEDENISKSEVSSLKEQRESMKSYLKLVTVTPQDEIDTKTPKALLSPRELFFIDLIREAEKAEQSRGNNPAVTERKHFFPNDFPSAHKDVVKRDLNERKDSAEASDKERETSYFIADIGSPKSEKAEVFLEIKPDSELANQWIVNLNEEKPVLILENSVKNENTEEKVVLFEV